MHLLTPKILLDTYFREPHFNQGELFMLRVFPTLFLRSGIFMWACIMPHRTERRYMIDIHVYAPKWYVLCSRVFMLSTIGIAAIWLPLSFGLAIYIEFFESNTTTLSPMLDYGM